MDQDKERLAREAKEAEEQRIRKAEAEAEAKPKSKSAYIDNSTPGQPVVKPSLLSKSQLATTSPIWGTAPKRVNS